MSVINRKTSSKPHARTIVTIGIFDGVHRGHARVISTCIAEAKKRRARSVAITFFPHPMRVLSPRARAPKMLISLGHRLRLIKSLGVDRVIAVRFTRSFAGLSCETFVKRYLRDVLHLSGIVVGHDFRFGAAGQGDQALLRRLGKEGGFSVTVVPSVVVGRRIVSSSAIRRLIDAGRLKEAGLLLGRPVTILGTVVHGVRIGRLLGYPTANIEAHHEAIPPCGVYAVRVTHKEKVYGGVLNIGFRPTIDRKKNGRERREPVVEVHLFDFNGHIYGDDVEIEFVRLLRKEKRFRSSEALAAQIRADCAVARRALAAQEKRTKR